MAGIAITFTASAAALRLNIIGRRLLIFPFCKANLYMSRFPELCNYICHNRAIKSAPAYGCGGPNECEVAGSGQPCRS